MLKLWYLEIRERLERLEKLLVLSDYPVNPKYTPSLTFREILRHYRKYSYLVFAEVDENIDTTLVYFVAFGKSQASFI